MKPIQKKEKALRSKYLYYKGLFDKGTIRIQQPFKPDPDNENKRIPSYLIVEDLMRDLEHELFKLQSKMIQQGLPILPLP